MDGQTDILPLHSLCYAYVLRGKNDLMHFLLNSFSILFDLTYWDRPVSN